MRRNSNRTSFLYIFLIIAFAIPFITRAIDVFSFFAFRLLIPLLTLCVISLTIIAVVKGNNSKPKANLTEDLLKLFNKINFKDNKVIIDDESYLLITNTTNPSLEDIDIIVNDEYIGNLSEFSHSYPNAFNNLCSRVIKDNKKKKNTKTEEVKEPVKPTTIEKDCYYYINKFHQLDEQIENESVKTSIRETISYLNEIKKIEDEFGESKDKTRKLYEYYLPMYADILANYDRLHDNAPQSEEFKENETKLVKTSQLINTALKSVSSSLMERYYTDLNVNMKTLESILKKDGLVDEKMEAK